MVQTRSGVGATEQMSLFALGVLAMVLGVNLALGADNDTQLVIGVVFFIGGMVVIFAKYFLKLPDVSEQEMLDTINSMAAAYEAFLLWAQKTYTDVHELRDEIVKHRILIETTAQAILPPAWFEKLKTVLDALEGKYAVSTSTRPRIG